MTGHERRDAHGCEQGAGEPGTRPVALAFGIWHLAFGIRLLAHGDGQTKCELRGSSALMDHWIEHETERKIGIGAKQTCQAAKRVWLCGMWGGFGFGFGFGFGCGCGCGCGCGGRRLFIDADA